MSYHIFNTQVAKKVGIVEAVLLHNIQFWIDKNRVNEKHFYKGKYWTYNSAKAFAELFPYLSNQQISRALKRLVDDGWLIKDNFNTNPFDRTNWYALSDKYYIEFMPENAEVNSELHTNQEQNADKSKSINAQFKNDFSYIDTDSKLTDSKLTDSKPDINNNLNNNITEDSNILNNKRDLEKEIKEKYKKEKKKKNIFDEALELYPKDEKLSFSYDDWKEWVEYKVSIGKNLTILTFKKNLQQLITFGELAKQAIDISISNNWVGLFPPHQKVAPNANNATNRNFKGGGLSARDKFANMDNPDYDASVYDFSLLPSVVSKDGK